MRVQSDPKAPNVQITTSIKMSHTRRAPSGEEESSGTGSHNAECGGRTHSEGLHRRGLCRGAGTCLELRRRTLTSNESGMSRVMRLCVTQCEM